MRTEDLIDRLAQEAALPPAPSLGRRVGMAVGLGLLVTFGLFQIALGFRPGLIEAMSQPITLAKTLIPLGLGLLALVLAQRAAHPGTGPGAPRWGIPVLVGLALALLVGAFVWTDPALRLARFLGHSIPICLPAITVLSVPMLAGLLVALRRGASLNPMRSGALAGLAAAGLATTIYSTFCTEDSPLFYVIWYGLGISIVTLAGAMLGGRWLRW